MFLKSIYRFNCAIYDQPHFIEASFVINQATALILFIIGTLLVLSSFWQLGITGTYIYCTPIIFL